MGQALIFSGQGAQYVGMGGALCQHFAPMKTLFDRANSIVSFDLQKICMEGPEDTLTRTDVCQLALFTVGYGCFKFLQEKNILKNISACFGQSLGELTALAAAGVISFDDGLQLVSKRAQYMQEACEKTSGTMMCLVGGDRDRIIDFCQKMDVEISNVNAPDQVVISGEKQRVQETAARISECGVRRAILLNVAGGYHSKLMLSAQERFAKEVETTSLCTPEFTFIANVTGEKVDDLEKIRRLVVEQITSTVHWEKCVKYPTLQTSNRM
jgi:[acyl-carrier-protein] S-malonyltransferase